MHPLAFQELPGTACHGFVIAGFSVGLIPLCQVCAAGLVNVEFEAFAWWELLRN
jgi:hypothetical protein